MNLIKTLISCGLFVAASGAAAETLWEQYLALPTPLNAARVDRIEYSPGAIPEGYGYLESDLEILRLQITGGDAEAFRLAYRLRTHTQAGHLLEELTRLLGRAVRPQPTMFLREMKALAPPEESLRRILKMVGLEYVDRRQAAQHEREMRREALRSVADPALQRMRDSCLALLKKP